MICVDPETLDNLQSHDKEISAEAHGKKAVDGKKAHLKQHRGPQAGDRRLPRTEETGTIS